MAVICWFAALFYLPRLFVYHAMAEDAVSIDRFKLMERKLYRGIANPSMIATVILGLWLVYLNPQAYLSQGWFHLKALLVVVLIVAIKPMFTFGFLTKCRFYLWSPLLFW
jgi:putative membrane protein